MWTRIAGVAGAAGLALMLAACGNNNSQDVGKITVDWTGNDVVIEAVEDPQIKGVVCHVSLRNSPRIWVQPWIEGLPPVQSM